jgi:hypothetical protein
MSIDTAHFQELLLEERQRVERAIAPERLDAYPWASLCIDCKREAERG